MMAFYGWMVNSGGRSCRQLVQPYRSSLCIYYGNDDGAHAGGVSTAHGKAWASSNGAGLERCSSWWPVLGSSGSMARSDGRGVEHERRGHVKELRPAEGAEHLTKSKKRGRRRKMEDRDKTPLK